MVSSQSARSALLRVAPSRRVLAIPSSISATVTADINKEAECVSIHSTSADGTSRDGAAAEMTLVSTRYTAVSETGRPRARTVAARKIVCGQWRRHQETAEGRDMR